MEEIEHWVAKVMHKERGGGYVNFIDKNSTKDYNFQSARNLYDGFEIGPNNMLSVWRM